MKTKTKCYDCDLLYSDFPIDMMIQGELWEIINPSTHPGEGLLCPNCICRRLRKLGLTYIHCIVDLAELLPNIKELLKYKRVIETLLEKDFCSDDTAICVSDKEILKKQ